MLIKLITGKKICFPCRRTFSTRKELDEKELRVIPKSAIIKLWLNEKDTWLSQKNTWLNERDLLERLHGAELTSIHTKYMKLKGNLNVRGIIEAIENSDEFFRIIDENALLAPHAKKKLTRQEKWDMYVARSAKGSQITKCVGTTTSKRRESIGTQIKDLYNAVSKDVHKPDDSDVVWIRRGALYDYQVLNKMCLHLSVKIFNFFFIYDKVDLTICLCQHARVSYEIKDEYVPESNDNLDGVDD